MAGVVRGPLASPSVAGNLDPAGEGRVDPADSDAFMTGMYEFEAEHAKRRAEMRPRITSLLEEYRTAKSRLLGEDRLRRRSALSASRRQVLRELANRQDVDFRQIGDFRRDTRRQAQTLVSQVDSRKLMDLRESVARDLAKLAHGGGKLPAGQALDSTEVPEHIRSGRHNPSFAVTAPYPWSWTTFHHWFTSGSSEVTSWYLDAAQGKVGHRVTYQNYDPGDSDWCDTEARSSVGFTVPALGATGKWKFWIEVVCGASRGLFRWEDEFGSSVTHNDMASNMRITISTSPETPDLLYHPYERFTIWNQNWHGDDDWYHLFEFQPHGWTKTYVWTTPFVVPDRNAIVTIGTADYTSYWLDDIELDNAMNNRWYIKRVVIEPI